MQGERNDKNTKRNPGLGAFHHAVEVHDCGKNADQ